jgi:hypothetical protein
LVLVVLEQEEHLQQAVEIQYLAPLLPMVAVMVEMVEEMAVMAVLVVVLEAHH